MRGGWTIPDDPYPALSEVNHEPAEPAFRRLAIVASTLSRILGRREWSRQEKIPQDGGVVVVSNHTSNFDPIVVGLFLIFSGRWPRYLGKIQLFRSPFIGWLARACGQIPVERGTDRAAQALQAAQSALDEGKCVAVYPEGTLTKDPEGWPMTGRTGTARLALETGVPVIPIGQWGAQAFMPEGVRFPIHFGLRHRFTVTAGDPVPLDDLRALPVTHETVAEATNRIMNAITDLVSEVRQLPAPETRWDDKLKTHVPIRRSLQAPG